MLNIKHVVVLFVSIVILAIIYNIVKPYKRQDPRSLKHLAGDSNNIKNLDNDSTSIKHVDDDTVRAFNMMKHFRKNGCFPKFFEL